jgi:hypothetical protein
MTLRNSEVISPEISVIGDKKITVILPVRPLRHPGLQCHGGRGSITEWKGRLRLVVDRRRLKAMFSSFRTRGGSTRFRALEWMLSWTELTRSTEAEVGTIARTDLAAIPRGELLKYAPHQSDGLQSLRFSLITATVSEEEATMPQRKVAANSSEPMRKFERSFVKVGTCPSGVNFISASQPRSSCSGVRPRPLRWGSPIAAAKWMASSPRMN